MQRKLSVIILNYCVVHQLCSAITDIKVFADLPNQRHFEFKEHKILYLTNIGITQSILEFSLFDQRKTQLGRAKQYPVKCLSAKNCCSIIQKRGPSLADRIGCLK